MLNACLQRTLKSKHRLMFKTCTVAILFGSVVHHWTVFVDIRSIIFHVILKSIRYHWYHVVLITFFFFWTLLGHDRFEAVQRAWAELCSINNIIYEISKTRLKAHPADEKVCFCFKDLITSITSSYTHSVILSFGFLQNARTSKCHHALQSEFPELQADLFHWFSLHMR